MKVMLTKYTIVSILVLLLLATKSASSSEEQNSSPSGEHRNISLNFAVGDGFFRGGGEEYTQGKLLSLSYSDSLPDFFRLPSPFVYEVTGGVFNQKNFFNSSHTGFGSFTVGVEVIIPAGIYARVLGGPALITHTDDRLGGIFQFVVDGGIGFTYNKARVGVFYQHFSNGGITTTNQGRDFYGVEVGMNF